MIKDAGKVLQYFLFITLTCNDSTQLSYSLSPSFSKPNWNSWPFSLPISEENIMNVHIIQPFSQFVYNLQ